MAEIPIWVEKFSDAFLVWNLEEVKSLRENYRIVGSFVGCLSQCTQQNYQLGLPLMLSSVEVGLLLKNEDEGKDKPDAVVEQSSVTGAESDGDIDATRIVEPDSLPLKNLIVPIANRNPFATDEFYDEMSFNDFLPSIDRVRFPVFTDLHNRGYYITSGLKFGCDYLLYPGDPLAFHASHLVHCAKRSKQFRARDLLSWCRLGTQVKKIVLLCSVDDESNVAYTSLKWDHTS
ncbi:unnamed protein product [Soboliphyme baturini]|uniref:tRNA-splicing endonuclease subunit SEN34 n=1 Tax=Soboliphyme baturini TaxID=241478 RepID=A0A183J352_9BILA|nr:unnamed protein product [Soboliphyme baturini]